MAAYHTSSVTSRTRRAPLREVDKAGHRLDFGEVQILLQGLQAIVEAEQPLDE